MKKDKFSVTQTGCQIVNAASGGVTNNPMGAPPKGNGSSCGLTLGLMAQRAT